MPPPYKHKTNRPTEVKMKLLLSGVAKLLFGALLIGAMLFLPAWTVNYFGAWLFIGVLFVPMIIMGGVLLFRSPDLLARRLDGKEKAKTQKGVVALSGLMFPVGFVISALDFRFGWSGVRASTQIIAALIFLFGYGLYAEVMRENAYLSRTVKVEQGQTVISTGLYGVVRHPMYLATLFMFLSIPLILGSLWGVIPFLLYPAIIVVRILDEEKLLTAELSGYDDYRKKVKFRLIPFIW